ncbi:MAG TPA: cysteine-rich CWC family protein [Terriglobia bacterium]|nr:cysteine-rich CWC family protein [Terriglobia bacterium]
MLLPSKRPSTFEACGGTLQCGASLKGCGCASVPLSDEARTNLRGKYNNCLCPQCLNNLSEKPTSR